MAIEITSVRHTRRKLPRAAHVKHAATKVRESAAHARSRAGLLQILSIASLVSLTALVVSLFYLYTSYSKIVDERLASGYLTSRAGIYAAPRVLRAGQSLTRERLVESLRRAGYVDAEASDVWSGRFFVESEGIRIHPRRAQGASIAPAYDEVFVEFDKKNRVASLKGDGATLDNYALEPEALTNDAATKTDHRAALAYQDIPPVLKDAILAIEDRRFFEHRGLDGFGIARAALSWAKGDKNDAGDARRQGGSTITQQLVKNTYLTPERTLRRKFDEAMLASALERRLSKEDIFALYCNEIYMGQRGAFAVRGVAQAARVYFGKDLKDLSLAEAATIAGMIQSPARYAPDRRAEKSKQRRDTVIEAMLRENFVSTEQADAAKSEPVAVTPASNTNDATAPYFIDYANRLAEARLDTEAGEADAPLNDLRIHTTIDLELQQLAEAAISKQLDKLDKVYKGRDNARPQAALVALDPRTGHVLAMVGGRSYAESQLNRATDARRQPGSIFKPFIYAAALESGVSPVSTYADAPREFLYDVRAKYKPANYGNAYSNRDVTMRDGLIRSLNVVTVDVAMRTGLARVAGVAESFGLPRPEAYPSLALGTTEATPLEMASAYAAFANGGRAVKPVVIARADGEQVDESVAGRNELTDASASTSLSSRQVVRPSTAYMMSDMLGAVIDHGTARAARGALKGVAVAGKTGTSRDGWFAGYTPNLVCVVWVGFDDNTQLGLTGAESALPAWVEFVKGAVELRPELGGAVFERPAGIVSVEIDPETGLLASPACPQRERVAITGGLSPGYECTTHSPVYDSLADADEEGDFDTAGEVTTSDVQTDDGSLSLTSAGVAQRPVKVKTLPPSVAQTDTVVIALPSSATTGVEASGGGRPKLTNEMSVATAGAQPRHR